MFLNKKILKNNRDHTSKPRITDIIRHLVFFFLV